MNVKAYRQKRADLVEKAREIMAQAENETRAMSEEEAAKFEALMAEVAQIKQTIAQAEGLEEEERSLSQSLGRATRGTRAPETDALRSWLLNDSGPRTLSATLRPDALRSMRARDAWEARALSVGTATAGGHTVPQDFSNALEVALLAHDGMRGVANVFRTSTGAALPWPTSNDTANEGTLIDENSAAAENDVTFGSVSFGSYKMTSGIVRVSHELLQDSGVNVAQVVGSLLGERIGRALNRYHTSGTGVNQFQGAATVAVVGVTGATLGAITYDEIVDLQHSVDPAYRSGAVFVMHDTTVAALKKLKDGDGRPLWIAGMAEGEPGTLLGHRIVVNQHMPTLGTAGAKSVLFGDASKFRIRDVADIQIVRADERYFEYGQTAFVGWYRGDSRMIDAGTNPLKAFRNKAA